MMRPWHLRAWSGINISAWFRALADHRFAVSPTRVPMALMTTVLSLINSPLGLLQSLIYGRRIRATPIDQPPIFVLGHWRAGTTLLHELLVCDPRYTFPDTYACFSPNHFLLTRYLARFLSLLLPPQRPMDNMPIGWGYPQEDEWALANTGLPSPYLKIMFPNSPPRHSEYLDLRGVPPAELERWKQKLLWFLQSLTLRNPKRIVLKTPLHTARVRTLLSMFPEARFVHVVRDPFVVFPSTVHTWQQMYKFEAMQAPPYGGLEEYVLDTFVRMYRAFEEDVSRVPSGQLCEVHFEELVRDMPGQMERIYDQLGLGGFEDALPALEAYVAKTAKYQPNHYEISAEMCGQITTRWHNYIEKYGYAQPVRVQ